LANESEKNRRLKISTTLTPSSPQHSTTLSSDGMISFTDNSFSQSAQASEGGATLTGTKLVPDFIGLQQAPANTTNTTQEQPSNSPTFLFYYVIAFVFLVLFLIILMLRLMM
jgi:hypothetical protein